MRLRLHFMLCAFILSTFRGGYWNLFFLSLLLLPFLSPKPFFFFPLCADTSLLTPRPPGPLTRHNRLGHPELGLVLPV